MPTESDSPFRTIRLPFGLTRQQLWEWAYRVVILFGFLGLFYLKSMFASADSVKAVDARVAPLVDAQQSIEKKVTELEANQRAAAITVQEIRVDLAAIKAGQAEAQRANERNFDQVLRQLNRGAPRNP